jgi:hypothetical protein
MLGVTILKRNDAGLILSIAIYHRPLQASMQFSAKLGEKPPRRGRRCLLPHRSARLNTKIGRLS